MSLKMWEINGKWNQKGGEIIGGFFTQYLISPRNLFRPREIICVKDVLQKSVPRLSIGKLKTHPFFQKSAPLLSITKQGNALFAKKTVSKKQTSSLGHWTKIVLSKSIPIPLTANQKRFLCKRHAIPLEHRTEKRPFCQGVFQKSHPSSWLPNYKRSVWETFFKKDATPLHRTEKRPFCQDVFQRAQRSPRSPQWKTFLQKTFFLLSFTNWTKDAAELHKVAARPLPNLYEGKRRKTENQWGGKD